mgnify:CR=1 FL=1
MSKSEENCLKIMFACAVFTWGYSIIEWIVGVSKWMFL